MEDEVDLLPAIIAWAGLTAYIAVADGVLISARSSTMSTAFRTAATHPVRRWPITALWAVVTIHLFCNWKHDPISAVGRRLSR